MKIKKWLSPIWTVKHMRNDFKPPGIDISEALYPFAARPMPKEIPDDVEFEPGITSRAWLITDAEGEAWACGTKKQCEEFIDEFELAYAELIMVAGTAAETESETEAI